MGCRWQKSYRKTALAAHLCGLVFVCSDFATWSKSDLHKMITAMQQKVSGSESSVSKRV
jgi:hypothetical protein